MTDSLSIHGNIKFYMCKHAFFSKKSYITDSILTIYFKVLCICGKTTSILMLNIYLSFQCVFFKIGISYCSSIQAFFLLHIMK